MKYFKKEADLAKISFFFIHFCIKYLDIMQKQVYNKVPGVYCHRILKGDVSYHAK